MLVFGEKRVRAPRRMNRQTTKPGYNLPEMAESSVGSCILARDSGPVSHPLNGYSNQSVAEQIIAGDRFTAAVNVNVFRGLHENHVMWCLVLAAPELRRWA